MKPGAEEWMLRCLDGKATVQEREAWEALLRDDPEARAYLRELAEQAVLLADLERTTSENFSRADLGVLSSSSTAQPRHKARWAPWARGAVAAAALLALLAVALSWLRTTEARSKLARVTHATGSRQFLGSRGELDYGLNPGVKLRAGDTIETRSCDAWVELELRDGTKMTIGGHSSLRLLDGLDGGLRLKMTRGNLWVSPGKAASENLVIQTPTLAVQSRAAQFDVQASGIETLVRVNEGVGSVARGWDGGVAKLGAGQQIHNALGRKDPLQASPQPAPVHRWETPSDRNSAVILGRWFPGEAGEAMGWDAEPLLWPVPDREPVLLFAVSFVVPGAGKVPLQLRAGSKLVFEGRTDRKERVRFGFSTQKMRGVYAGKFETDVQPEELGAEGAVWRVELPLERFRPLQPQLSSKPDGLEMTDLYALTIRENAGLAIFRAEVLP